jgi:hypothetical protein
MYQARSNILICLVIIFSSCSFGTGKKAPVSVKECKPSFNYKFFGHSQFNLFIYKVRQTDSNSQFIRQDTLGLFCTNIPTHDSGMTSTQWKFMTTDSSGKYILDRKRYTGHSESTISFEDGLFLHPARCCFKILQLCPYPCFQNKKTWNWDFEIGASWGVDTLYPIENSEVFHITYTWEQQEEQLKSYFGELICLKLNAVSKSVFGTSYAAYYINEEHGLVYFTVTAVNGQTYEFSLMNKIEGKDAMSKIAPFFVSDHTRSKRVQELLLMK